VRGNAAVVPAVYRTVLTGPDGPPWRLAAAERLDRPFDRRAQPLPDGIRRPIAFRCRAAAAAPKVRSAIPLT